MENYGKGAIPVVFCIVCTSVDVTETGHGGTVGLGSVTGGTQGIHQPGIYKGCGDQTQDFATNYRSVDTLEFGHGAAVLMISKNIPIFDYVPMDKD